MSLRANRGSMGIDLARIRKDGVRNEIEKVIIEETHNLLMTGEHSLSLDMDDFTDFQRRVFAVVRDIEPGKILTYKGVAEILGKPGAAQAVGNAIAKNPVSYFLPTHRVLPQKGLGICRSGAGHLREKFLAREGHDLTLLRGDYICQRKKCCLE
jgi:O-6-methylguanine DNA methyltransferase